MGLACPHCHHALSLKAPKPGRYTPKCPKCAQGILIVVPSDPQQAPTALPLVAGQPAAAATQVVSAKVPPASAASADITAEFKLAGAAGGATAEFKSSAPPTSTAAPPRPAAANSGARPTAVVRAKPLSQAAVAAAARADEATAVFVSDPTARPAVKQPALAAKGPGRDAAHAPTAAPAGSNETADFSLGSKALAASASQSASSARAPAQALTLPARLGGYELFKELGRGGMGEVYLARQISLDRNVAVKTMRSEWAVDPVYVARFTREAFAAAQLVHHNVVQIHDFGAERETNFFSMEFVEGVSLAQLVATSGKLAGEVAAGYILQAARGLAVAHEKGMVHRDIKPDNLLLNNQGIVKIADLGIVKKSGGEAHASAGSISGAGAKNSAPATADVQATQAGVGLGTPAFMSPEQARDAASVDPRADIYSLGCTLYALVTGRPPFEGKTLLELITKHATEPVVPPDAVVKGVPKTLSDIIVRMVAKKPEARYQTMTEVIRALERFLGTDSTRPFSPREEHVEKLEQAATAFQRAGLARARPILILCFIALSLLGTIGGGLLGGWTWAAGFVGLAVLTPLVHFVLSGMLDSSHVFARVRALAFSATLKDWLIWTCGGLIALVVSYLLGLLVVELAVCVAAVLLAVGFYFGVDRTTGRARCAPLAEIEQLLRQLRLQSLEEDSLRQFVSRYSGPGWEPLYESLFGYEAKLQARQRWGKGENGLARPKFAAWRDPLVRSIDARLQGRSANRQRDHLIKVEQNGFQAAGLSPQEAQKKAIETAAALMLKANKQISKPTSAYDDSGGWAPVRLLAGGALMIGCLMWMHENGLLPNQKIKQLAARVQAVAGANTVAPDTVPPDAAPPDAATGAAYAKLRTPLALPLVSTSISRYFGNFFAGGAGLVLAFSALLKRWSAVGFSLIAAGVFAGQFLAGAEAGPQLTADEGRAICAAENEALDQLAEQRHRAIQKGKNLAAPLNHSIAALENELKSSPIEGEENRIRRQIGKFRRELEVVEEESTAELKRIDEAIALHQAKLASAKQAIGTSGAPEQPGP